MVPKVEVGLATYLGLASTVAGALATFITTILDGYHGQETKWFLTATVVVASVTKLGRMLQAAASVLGTGGNNYAPDVGDVGPGGARARPPR